MATPSELIKFEVCLYKKDGASYEDFVEWATKVYPPRAMPLMKKHGVVKWVQTVIPPRFRGPFREVLKGEMQRPGWTVPDYDLVHTYYLRSHDDMKAVALEPAWQELEREAQGLANMSVGHYINGHEIVQFEGNA